MQISRFFNLLVLLFFMCCGTISTAQTKFISSVIQSIQKRYAQDNRIAVFNITYTQTSGGIILRGEIGSNEAKSELMNTLKRKVKGQVIDNIHVVPDSSIGNNSFGIITAVVGDVRKKPGIHEERVTQVLMGAKVTLLSKNENFFLIQMADRYLGWIDGESVRMMNPSSITMWEDASHVIVTSLQGNIFEKADPASSVLCTSVMGCLLKRDQENNGWIAVELPDGQRGYISHKDVQDYNEWKTSRRPSGENLEQTARAFLNIPYLWGGTSARGFDCSGFTQTVYRWNGVELNRDADQQAQQGVEVEAGKDFQNLRKGDLLFFGQPRKGKEPERITHVGMYLENQMFIHSSGHKTVRVASFNSTSMLYGEYLKKIFIRARRIISHEPP